jgi:hypothetical protein
MLDWKSVQQESKLHAVSSDSNFLFLFLYEQDWIYYLFNFQSHSYGVWNLIAYFHRQTSPRSNGYHDRLPKSLPTHSPWSLFLLIQHLSHLRRDFISFIKRGSYYHPCQLYRAPHLIFLRLRSTSSVISNAQIPPSRKKYYSVKKKEDNSVGTVIRLQATSPSYRGQIIHLSSPKVPHWLWRQTSFLFNGDRVTFSRGKATGAWS